MTRRHAWYIKEWLGNWERSCSSSRWHKGRILQQQRRVQEVVIRSGHLIAYVNDIETYRCQIECQPIQEEHKRKIRDAFLDDPSFILKMYRHELTLDAVQSHPLSLGFYVPHMEMACSCSEPDLPCRHLIASVLAAADRFDEDPAQYLRFVGMPWESILSGWGRNDSRLFHAWPDEKFGYVSFPPKMQKEERKNTKSTPPFWTSPFPFQQIMEEIYWKASEEEE